MAKRQARAAAPQQPAALVGAARRIDVGANTPNGYRYQVRMEKWQEDAWAFFDLIGLVKQATYFLANTCSLVRLYVAVQPEPDQDPSPAPDGTAGLMEANDALERLKGGRGGHGAILRGFTINLKVPGEAYLVGEPEVPEQPPSREHPDGVPAVPERWDVRSVSQLVMEGRRYAIKERRDGTTKRMLPEETFILRVWQEHPEYIEEADSALRGAIDDCEALWTLSRAVKAIARSRIATGGMVVFPNSMTIVPAEAEDGDQPDGPQKTADFMRAFMDAATEPIRDEGHAMAAAPIVVRGPDEHVDKVRFVKFERPLESEFRELRNELRTALANALDIPIEQVSGLGGTNHWAAWKIDQQTWDRFGEPVMALICEALTVGFLRPIMETPTPGPDGEPGAAGVAPDVAAKLMVWFDPAGAIADPDPSQTAKEGVDLGALSLEAWRTVGGYSEDDAPTPEELAWRAEWIAAQRGSSPADATGMNPGATPQTPPQASVRTNGYRTLTAATAKRSIGARLGRLDRALRARLEEAAEAAMRRLMERAGAKVRNKASRSDGAMRAAVDGVRNTDVLQRLGPSLVAALGFTDEDLLGDGLAELERSFDARVRRAQDQTRRILDDELGLDDAELRDIEAAQDGDRQRAWAWLAAALATLATQRLFNPSPEAPPVGEFNADTTVPPGLIREALQRAGGAPGGPTTRPQPPGGVALGDLALDVFARHGRVVQGWVWDYGDPGSRTTPFEPHLDLDGQQFDSWDDPVLALTAEGDWIDGDFYRPGDHEWCGCDFEAVGLEEELPVAASAAPAGAVRNMHNGDRS